MYKRQVPKDPVPPTERLPETVRAPVSVSPAVVSEVVVMLVKLPVPPVNVPAIDRLLTKVLPLPFTKNGELVPLNTWKPPPEVAMNPALAETEPEVRALVFTLLAETAAAEREPKVPVLDTAMEPADALGANGPETPKSTHSQSVCYQICEGSCCSCDARKAIDRSLERRYGPRVRH